MVQGKDPPHRMIFGFFATGDLGPLTIYTSQRNRVVLFPKSPPLNPPSPLQRSLRNQMRLSAMAWRGLTPAQRSAWSRAAPAAGLRISGYNLWVHYQRYKDDEIIRGVERRSGEQLLSG